MLKIGDFSRICQVSIKSLRHWDSLDLLQPAHIDPQSGYRYYTIEQLTEVNRIIALKAMGLELAQIARLMRDTPTLDDIRAMLRLKQADLRQQIDQATVMLQVVESRLEQIEHDGRLPQYEVSLKPTPSQQALAVRRVFPNFRDLVDVLHRAYPYARQRDNAHLVAVFHDDAFQDESIDIEIAIPVDAREQPLDLTADTRLTMTTLPEVELMACTVHHGTWLNLSHGYVFIGQWIERSGYRIAGPGREIFHRIDWEHHQRDTITEIQFPVTRLS